MARKAGTQTNLEGMRGKIVKANKEYAHYVGASVTVITSRFSGLEVEMNESFGGVGKGTRLQIGQTDFFPNRPVPVVANG